MPRTPPWLLLAGLLLAASAAELGAQSFSGTGQQATELFPLSMGLAVFELEHQGEAGPFAVRLLDAEGRLVEELARASGRFSGSRAVRIPRDGQYLLDVTASGAWSVRRRDNAPGAAAADAPATGVPTAAGTPGFRRGEAAGLEAAAGVGAAGWFVRGFVGGALAGPIGAAIAVGSAGRSGSRDAALRAQAEAEPGFRQGFEEAYLAQVRQERRKRAFIGGMMGTGVFLTAVIASIDIASRGGGGTTTPPPPGGEVYRGVPLHP